MSPGTYNELDAELQYGTITMGQISIMWDFRDIYKRRRKEEELKERNEHFIKNGRTIMPSLNIL